MALTVDKIVDELVSRYKLQRREATDFVDTFFDDIKRQVEAGARVRLTNFGSMFLRTQRVQRKRRDIPIDEDTPRWRTPAMTPAVALRARVQRAQVEIDRDVD